jgi:hypothetical protein
MFRPFRRSTIPLSSPGAQRWFSSTKAFRLIACRGVVAGKATQASFRPLTGLIQLEYAKSSRSNCAMCGFSIEAGSLRIGTFHQGTGDFAIAAWQHPRCYRSMTLPLYPDVEKYQDDDIALKQLSYVKPGDRDLVAKLLTDDDACTWNTLLTTVLPATEVKAVDEQLGASTIAHEALAEWSTTDLVTLFHSNVSPEEATKRGASGKKPDRDIVIDKVTSMLLFGPSAPCQSCSGGELVPNEATGAYRCSGHFDAFTRCGTVVPAIDIRRVELNVPPSVKNIVSDLKKKIGIQLPFSKQILVGHVVKQAAAKWHGLRVSSSTTTTTTTKKYGGLSFFTTHASLKDESIYWDAVTSGGGTVIKKKQVEKGEFQQDGSSHGVVQGNTETNPMIVPDTLPLVSSEWVQESAKVLRPLTAIEGYTYYRGRCPPAVDAKWIQALTARNAHLTPTAAGTVSPSSPTSSSSTPSPSSSSTTSSVVFSGNAPVDAESNLAGTHTVFHTDDLPWSATLSLVDLSTDKNTFYILQLLEATELSPQNRYVVFRRWGRLGDALKNGSTVETFHSAERAKQKFAKYFMDRTDNAWEPTIEHARRFLKKPGKYSWVDPPLAEGDEDALQSKASTPSDGSAAVALQTAPSVLSAPVSLPRETEKLMELLFDEESIQRSMATMNIDTKKMPLPGLNARAVNEGRSVLQRLMKEHASTTQPPTASAGGDNSSGPAAAPIAEAPDTKPSRKKTSKEQLKKKKQQTADQAAQKSAETTSSVADVQRRQRNILSLSNQFYSHIPHVRTESAESFLLNTSEKIASKFQLLDDLEDILLTKKMMLQKTEQPSNQRLVAQYKALHVDLQPLSTTTDEGKMVATYFQHSHGATHRKFTLRHLWKLDREGEEQQFDPWKSFPNRKLLWHGSRLTNWVRILKTGLKIAPPDAPVSGYMFGKGIYFADMISKSANYCCMDSSSGDGGLLILAEVALGTPTKRYHSDYITSLPEGTHSTYALGRSMPDPAGDLVLPSGLVVPTGRPINQPDGYHKCSLMYNEFIVYDVTQVRLKYLLHVDA